VFITVTNCRDNYHDMKYNKTCVTSWFMQYKERKLTVLLCFVPSCNIVQMSLVISVILYCTVTTVSVQHCVNVLQLILIRNLSWHTALCRLRDIHCRLKVSNAPSKHWCVSLNLNIHNKHKQIIITHAWDNNHLLILQSTGRPRSTDRQRYTIRFI